MFLCTVCIVVGSLGLGRWCYPNRVERVGIRRSLDLTCSSLAGRFCMTVRMQCQMVSIDDDT